MEERLIEKSQADEDEDYMILTSLHITYNKQTEKKKSLSGQTCRIKCNHTCLRCIPRLMLVCCLVSVLAQCSRGLRQRVHFIDATIVLLLSVVFLARGRLTSRPGLQSSTRLTEALLAAGRQNRFCVHRNPCIAVTNFCLLYGLDIRGLEVLMEAAVRESS